MKKAVIYARYSSSHQREESIEGQVRVCTEYADKKGLNIIGTYIDRAITGRTDNRPDFQRLIEDGRKKLFDAVIVYKTDRFARNKYDSTIYKSQLKKQGIEIHYAAESIPDGPEGIILESLLEGLAEYYSVELAQKITRGLYENALKCRATGNTPLGYRVGTNHTYEIEPRAAEAVRKIYEMYVDGRRLNEITAYLNSIGIKTIRGNEFNKNSLRKILRNEKYCGVYKYKDVVVEGGMPQIISRELFNAAQTETARREMIRPAPNAKANYALTGALYCGECKTPMRGLSGTSHTGQKYYYYACRNKDMKASKDWLEDLVMRETLDYILRPDIAEHIAEKCVALHNQRSSVDYLKRQLADNMKAIKNIQAAIESGGYTRTMTDRIKELEEEQENIRFEIEKAKALNLTKEHIIVMLNKFAEPGDDIEKYKKKIIDCFISTVYLYKDKVIIIYNTMGPDGGKRKREITIIEKEFGRGEPASTRNAVARTRILVREEYFALIVFYDEKEKASRS